MIVTWEKNQVMKTNYQQLTELVNKLFIYTDELQWEKLLTEVFSEKLWFDMTSLGGEASEVTAKSITEMWDTAFQEIDSINHLGGNYLIKIEGGQATVFAYATATHYKESATNGKTREFVGTYDIKAYNTSRGWRINSFTYNLKYMTGNLDLS